MPEEEEEKGRLTAEDAAKLLKLLGLGFRPSSQLDHHLVEVFALESPSAVVYEKTEGFTCDDAWTCAESHLPKFLLEEVLEFSWSPRWHSHCDPAKTVVENPFFGCESYEECMLKWSLLKGEVAAGDSKEEEEKREAKLESEATAFFEELGLRLCSSPVSKDDLDETPGNGSVEELDIEQISREDGLSPHFGCSFCDSSGGRIWTVRFKFLPSQWLVDPSSPSSLKYPMLFVERTAGGLRQEFTFKSTTPQESCTWEKLCCLAVKQLKHDLAQGRGIWLRASMESEPLKLCSGGEHSCLDSILVALDILGFHRGVAHGTQAQRW